MTGQLAATGGPRLRRPRCLVSKRETPSRDTQPTLVEQSTRQMFARGYETNHCRTVTRHRSVPTDATATIQVKLYQPCQLPLVENKREVEHMTALPLRNLTL